MKKWLALFVLMMLVMPCAMAGVYVPQEMTGVWELTEKWYSAEDQQVALEAEWSGVLMEVKEDGTALMTVNGESRSYALTYEIGYHYLIDGEQRYQISGHSHGLMIDNDMRDGYYWLFTRPGAPEETKWSPFAYEVLADGTACITRCNEAWDEIVIPETIDGYTVSAIGDHAFAGEYITAVQIPSTVAAIGKGAFSGCESLTELVIPDGVTALGVNMAQNCSALERVSIPGSVQVIPEGSFMNCAALREVTFGQGVREIGDAAFMACMSLETVDLPEGVAALGVGAFMECRALKEVRLPSTLETVGTYAFATDQLTVRGPAGTAAEEYAKAMRFTFIAE